MVSGPRFHFPSCLPHWHFLSIWVLVLKRDVTYMLALINDWLLVQMDVHNNWASQVDSANSGLKLRQISISSSSTARAWSKLLGKTTTIWAEYQRKQTSKELERIGLSSWSDMWTRNMEVGCSWTSSSSVEVEALRSACKRRQSFSSIQLMSGSYDDKYGAGSEADGEAETGFSVTSKRAGELLSGKHCRSQFWRKLQRKSRCRGRLARQRFQKACRMLPVLFDASNSKWVYVGEGVRNEIQTRSLLLSPV